MNHEHKKEGVSVKELQNFVMRNKFEVFYCLLFVFASLFTLVFWGPIISVFLAGIGGIIGVLLPARVELFSRKTIGHVLKQERTTQLIFGIVGLILAIFLAPLVFLFLGLHGGKSMGHHSKEMDH